MLSLHLTLFLAATGLFASNGVQGYLSGINMPSVCQNLTQVMNTISGLLKFEVDFENGLILEEEKHYPAGKIFLDPYAQRLENCRAYVVSEDGISSDTNSTYTIVHMEFQDSLVMEFEPTLYQGNLVDIKIQVSGSEFVLHYQIHKTPQGQYKLSSIMGEIRNLGVVRVQSSDNSLSAVITNEAEDIIRPKLLEGFNWFAHQYLAWVVDPSSESVDGVEAMKYIFKGTMTNIMQKMMI